MVCVVDDRGEIVVRFEIANTGKTFTGLVKRLTKLGVGCVAIERCDGPLVEALLDAGHRVVVITPRQVKGLRSRYTASGVKSDAGDAYLLADVLRTDGHRLVALAQWLLLGLTLAGLVWIVLILVAGESGAHKSQSLAGDVSLAPWLGVMVVALLLLGWLLSSWCRNMVILAADREREQALRDILARIAAVANDLVVVPVGRELRDYERYRAELAAARDH